MDKYEEIINVIWNYEREKIKKEILELKEIPKEIQLKIKKFIERTYLDIKYEKIIQEELLKGNEIIITLLMKDPKRQNIYENILLNYLIEKGIDIVKLPVSGDQALYPINDEISNQTKDHVKIKELKSLDFKININNKKCIYLVHKYTNEDGGAQDNQFNDVIIQLKNLGPKTIKNVWFCLDGKYYNEKRISILKEINKDIKIVNIDNIEDEIKKL